MESTGSATKRKKEAPSSSNGEGESKGTPNEPLGYRHRAQSLIQSKALDELETEVFETGLYENLDLSRGSRYSVMAAEITYSEYNNILAAATLQCEITCLWSHASLHMAYGC